MSAGKDVMIEVGDIPESERQRRLANVAAYGKMLRARPRMPVGDALATMSHAEKLRLLDKLDEAGAVGSKHGLGDLLSTNLDLVELRKAGEHDAGVAGAPIASVKPSNISGQVENLQNSTGIACFDHALRQQRDEQSLVGVKATDAVQVVGRKSSGRVFHGLRVLLSDLHHKAQFGRGRQS